MDAISLNYDLDHIETLHRKKGILYARKAFRRKRDLLLSLLNSLNRSIILITVGRHLTTVENLEHECLKAVIRVKGNEVNGFKVYFYSKRNPESLSKRFAENQK